MQYISCVPCTPELKYMTTVYYKSSGPGTKICLSASPSAADTERPIRLEYLNEGNANIVYRIRPYKDGGEVPAPLHHKLLRVRKDKPFIQTCQEQHAAFKKRFRPLFSAEHLVEHDLIVVQGDLTRTLNTALKQQEAAGSRPCSRHGDLLATDDIHGMLVTDMTPQPGEVFLELKPKWLVQSPDAPRDSVRCRTCALRARRENLRREPHTERIPTSFCPLALVSASFSDRKKAWDAVANATRDFPSDLASNITAELAKCVMPVLEDLREYQIKLGSKGILGSLSSEQIPDEYLQAMTLRDCILLLRISRSDQQFTCEGRLADLDLKQAHPDKIHHWRQTEESLNKEGWYTNTEQNHVPDRICLLSRHVA